VNTEYDYVIAGGGSAGGTLAARPRAGKPVEFLIRNF